MKSRSIDSVVRIIESTPLESAERMRLRREESNIIRTLRTQQGAIPRSNPPANQNISMRPCPSQGSHYFVGLRRDTGIRFEWGDENGSSHDKSDNCWKRHRKTPWRRTPILTSMGQLIGYEQ